MFTGLLQKKALKGTYKYPDGRETQGRVLGRGPRGGAMPLVNTPHSQHLCVFTSSAGPSLGGPYGAFLTRAWLADRWLSLQPLSRAWGMGRKLWVSSQVFLVAGPHPGAHLESPYQNKTHSCHPRSSKGFMSSLSDLGQRANIRTKDAPGFLIT